MCTASKVFQLYVCRIYFQGNQRTLESTCLWLSNGVKVVRNMLHSFDELSFFAARGNTILIRIMSLK